MITTEQLMQIPLKDWTMWNVAKLEEPGISKGSAYYKYKAYCDSLVKKFKVKNFHYVYWALHLDEIRELMTRFSTLKEMCDYKGWPRADLNAYMIKWGLLRGDRQSSQYETLAHKQTVQLFRGDAFNDLESYLYGLYMGDGYVLESANGDRGIAIISMDVRDADHFRRLAEVVGVSPERKGKLEIAIRDLGMIKNLTRLGLLYKSKTKLGTSFNYEKLCRFKFFPFLRGLIETDGSVQTYRCTKGVFQRVAISLVNKEIIDAVSQRLLDYDINHRVRFVPVRERAYMKRPQYCLSICRPDIYKLLDQGFYSWRRDLAMERKIIKRGVAGSS